MMYMVCSRISVLDLVDTVLVSKFRLFCSVLKRGLLKGYHGQEARKSWAFIYYTVYCVVGYINLHVKSQMNYHYWQPTTDSFVPVLVDLLLISASAVHCLQLFLEKYPTVPEYLNTISIAWLLVLSQILFAVLFQTSLSFIHAPALFDFAAIFTFAHSLYLGQIFKTPAITSSYQAIWRQKPDGNLFNLFQFETNRSCVVENVSRGYCQCRLKEECGICLQKKQEECVVSLPCKHQFHVQCIKTWTDHGNGCPLCRRSYTLRFIYNHNSDAWYISAI